MTRFEKHRLKKLQKQWLKDAVSAIAIIIILALLTVLFVKIGYHVGALNT